MNQQKLSKIITEENEKREYEALNQARHLINEIARLQQDKTEADKRIAECRDELKALEVQALAADEVLGGE